MTIIEIQARLGMGWGWAANSQRRTLLALVVAFAVATARAGENVPRAPFAEWATLPEPDQFLATFVYQESEAYYLWDGAGRRYRVDWRQNGEHYGIDINQGYVSLQYGLNERWAADATFGFTALGWRYFSNFSTNGASESTTSYLDLTFGFRYQIFREHEDNQRWKPDLTFRAAAVIPGGFNENLPFAPGMKSTAIEPSLLLRKHVGWDGLGVYADTLFRWNHTAGNDLYIAALGFFQQIQRWELCAGWRHLQCIAGDEISFDPATRFITYPRAVREISDAVEAGFTYTTRRDHLRVGFLSRTVFDGVNTDKQFWVGGTVTIPFGGGKMKKD
jgi:hypothetical protein